VGQEAIQLFEQKGAAALADHARAALPSERS
jgi:hypothetical protein